MIHDQMPLDAGASDWIGHRPDRDQSYHPSKTDFAGAIYRVGFTCSNNVRNTPFAVSTISLPHSSVPAPATPAS